MHTDANAVAALLREVFAREMTGTERVCQSCHTRSRVGDHPLYRGAGIVLRCPACGDVAACFVPLATGRAVSLRGTWLLG